MIKEKETVIKETEKYSEQAGPADHICNKVADGRVPINQEEWEPEAKLRDRVYRAEEKVTLAFRKTAQFKHLVDMAVTAMAHNEAVLDERLCSFFKQ